MDTATESERLADAKVHHCIITAWGWEGVSVTTEDGRPATLAVVDEAGRIVESGPALVNELWVVAVMAYRSLIAEDETLTVWSASSGLYQGRHKP